MLFTTPTQFAVLALLLVIGWLFGFASHSGGKRWRSAYEEEATGRARDRDELDAQLRHGDGRFAELERERAALTARNDELERELARVKAEQPSRVTPALAGAAVGAVAATAARPAFEREREPVAAPAPATVPETAPAMAPAPTPQPEFQPAPAAEPVKRGWFDWGKTDDLSRVRGIDGDLEHRLKAEKVDSYRELANLSDQDELALERRLDLPAGYIQREELREQARLLADGRTGEHAHRYS